MSSSINFCHLHVHDEYSQLDGFGTAKNYAEKARELGFKHLALTNHGNIDGLIKFQQACLKEEIIPLLGCEAYVVPDDLIGQENKDRRRGHILLLAKNAEGFTNLCNILSFANLQGKYYKPRVSFTRLLDNCSGLVICTACIASFVGVFKRGVDFFYDLYDSVGDDLYCEIMPHNMTKQIGHNEEVLRLASRVGAKVVATNDCHYILRSDRTAHNILINIQTRKDRKDQGGWEFPPGDYHLCSSREMRQSLRSVGFYKREYMLNTLEVAEKCGSFRIEKMEVDLPRVRIRGFSIREENALWNLCLTGFRDRFGYDIQENQAYYARFKEEFEVVAKKKFCRYFLIVWELVSWCKRNKIFVGPGRGSVGGSLIAYLLKITSVDPLPFKLIFSRFISIDRIDYPDIDIDFEAEKRDLVKKHLESMYGAGNVAGVTTFQRMKARAVIKDVAREYDIPFDEVNTFTSFLDSSSNKDDGTSIKEAIEFYPECQEFAEKYPDVIDYAIRLEGQVRGYNLHAAALVLNRSNIARSGRCNLREEKGATIINWGKEDAEFMGLLKLDALGLKQLSIFGETLRLIKKNYGVDIDLDSVDLNDKKVLAELNNGNTSGVFQFNTYTETRHLKKMGCKHFNHLVASTALVRPGPAQSGMADEYVRRLKGGDWERKHPIYEEITGETYGVIVYQEQVMEVIYRVAGLSYSTADKIRKIIGKKRDKKEFEEYRIDFMEGCKQTGYFTQDEAEEFWEGLQEHARYSFNKSHATTYAMLGYWCSWLKYYYPTEFICGSLTYGAEGKKQDLVKEAYRLGLSLVLPKVGISHPTTWEAKEKNLYVPFSEIKGLGEKGAFAASVSPSQKYEGRGFSKMFNRSKKAIAKHEGKLGNLLDKIGAYNITSTPEITAEIRKLFDFPLLGKPEEQYKNLFDLLEMEVRPDKLDCVLRADLEDDYFRRIITDIDLIEERSFDGLEDLMRCEACELRDECNSPVPPSSGKYNVMIVGQDPGITEDEKGRGFTGKAGKKLWQSLGKYYPRELFHVTNAAKCFPRVSRKSSEIQAKKCSKKFLFKEINEVKPVLILALGGNAMGVLSGQWKGIMDRSGTAEWIDILGAWVIYCVHPAAVLHNESNTVAYQDGIRKFKRLLKNFGL